MADATNYLEEALLKHFLKIEAYESPDAVYLALGTGPPNEDGTWAYEVSGNNYARREITFLPPSGDPRVVRNNPRIYFPRATASWGLISHFAVFDHATAGNMLAFESFFSGLQVDEDQVLVVRAPNLELMLWNWSYYLTTALLNHTFRHAPFAQPAQLYVALCTEAVDVTDSGSTISEPNTNDYARAGSPAWSTPTQVNDRATSKNLSEVGFGEATEDWPDPIRDFALVDAPVGGNLLVFGSFGTSTNIVTGDSPTIAVNALTVELR